MAGELNIDPASLARMKAVVEKIPAQAEPRAAKALADIKGWIERKEAGNAGG